MQLYTVHFTTKQIVTKYDDKGRKTGEYVTDIAQTIHALPLSTAQGYKKFGNWKIEPYVADTRSNYSSPKQKQTYAGNKPAQKSASAPANKVDQVKNAAATGNLAAAINGVK